MNETFLVIVLLFAICGFIGCFVALRVSNLLLQVLIFALSFAIPFLIVRPLSADLLVAFISWGVGCVIAYFVSRRVA